MKCPECGVNGLWTGRLKTADLVHMDIFHTKVFSKPDRQRASQALLEDMRAGKSMLFHLVDKYASKISGSQRLAKRFGSGAILGRSRVGDRRLPCISNLGDDCEPLDAEDIQACVRGFNKSLPCSFAWVGSVDNRQRFIDWYDYGYGIDQNQFLPTAGNFFSSSYGGIIGISVTQHAPENAIQAIESIDSSQTFDGPSWAFVHVLPTEDEQLAIQELKLAWKAQVKRLTAKLVKSVRSKRIESNCISKCISFGKLSKRLYKRHGYTWNKAHIGGVTILDKATPLGNTVRLCVDQGGADRNIPYIEVQFVSPLFSSEPIFISHVCQITDETTFRDFIVLHLDDLQFFEQEIAPIYDLAVGSSSSEVKELMKRFSVREVI